MLKTIKAETRHALHVVQAHLRERSKRKTRSPHWESTAKAFLESHPACSACGATRRLQVHHRQPFHLHPELELDPTNLIGLCMSTKECHLRLGHGGNFKGYVPEIQELSEEMRANPLKWEEIEIKASKLLRF